MLTIKKKPVGSIRRSAEAFKDGPEILATLREPATRKLLLAAVEDQVPPVSRISRRLLDRHGEGVRALPIRQFVGTVVKSILAEEGYEVAATGVRIPKDPIFTTGAIYQKASPIRKVALRDPWERMFRGLEASELHAIIEIANRVLKERRA
jgi:hypothetical protein